MPNPIVVLEQDTTGLAPANLIQGEEHSPPPAVLRLIIPQWGAFFEESLVVLDAADDSPVNPSHYQMGDTWAYAQEISGKSVRSCFLLKPSAPVDIKISYQSFGGPQSRNAIGLVNWLNTHLQAVGGNFAFSDLKDLPEEYEPSEHKHLLAHVFGMEYVVDELKRVATSLNSERSVQLQIDYERAKQRLARMAIAADTTVSALVGVFWNSWRETVSLYALGVDLLRNYPALGAGGAYAAAPTFHVQNAQDERYVDLAGLGAFSKAMLERLVSAETGLGLDLATVREAQRGSFVGALVGEVFYLPSPKAARGLDYTNMKVYPKDWPENTPMVVVKQMASFHHFGGIFSAFNPTNGNQYIGILDNETWQTPLTWQRVYHSDETTAIATALQDHLQGREAAHDETKKQLGLGKVLNLPVVDADTIVTDEPKRMYVTYDALMAFVRARMEKIKLARKENGEVDYEAGTMDKTKIIINSGGCGTPYPPKDQFISSFCDGTDKYTRMSDGLGSYYDKLTEQNSADCGHSAYPEYGKVVSTFCEGTALRTRFSDGRGGYFTETTKINAEECGFSPALALGTVVSVFCSGVNQMTRYADGKGGTYDMPTMINTYLCGGTIYPSKDGNGDGGAGGTEKTLVLTSSREKIYTGTIEVLEFDAGGLTPNGSYTFALNVSSPGLNNGDVTVIYRGSFVAKADGTYHWKQTRTDDGTSTARGVYDTFVTIESANLESNHITRTFMEGADPDGGGVTPVDDMEIIFASDQSAIYVGTNETLTVALKGFTPDTTYDVEFWVSMPSYNNGAPLKTLTVQMHTASDGSAMYNLSQYDNGVTPRGMTDNWIEVKVDGNTVESNHIDRNFLEGSPPTSGTLQLRCVASRSMVYKDSSYTMSYVITGATPNTTFTLEFYRAVYEAPNQQAGMMFGSVILTTDGTGAARHDVTVTYDGITPLAKNYLYYFKLPSLAKISNMAMVTFVETTVPTTDLPRLTFTSDQQIIRPGTVETLRASLANYPPNTTQEVQFWNSSPVFNGGVDHLTWTTSCRVGSDGTGSVEHIGTDDGVTVPRGDYLSWVVTPSVNRSSSKITRSFLPAIVQTTAPPNIVVTYTTSASTLTIGTTETHYLVVTGLQANKSYDAKYYIKSDALNNGLQPLLVKTVTITSNSTGRAEYTFANTDDGITPRGVYTCWVEVGGARSANVIRTFVGTPAPTYNPVLTYSVSPTTISQGTYVTNLVQLTAAKPNTAYVADIYIQSSSLNGGAPYKTASVALTTNANGAASWSNAGYDDGVTVPRGSYTNWATITSLSLNSNVVASVWQGTPAPTAPPYNPRVSYYTSAYYIYPGTYETHTINLTGMQPNRSYNVQIWISSPALYNGQALNVKTVSIYTDASGNGTTSWGGTDDGVTVPRGTYSNWAVIVETGTTSSVFTRIFLSADSGGYG